MVNKHTSTLTFKFSVCVGQDDEQVPMLDNLFETVNQQMSNMMSNMPSLPRVSSSQRH